MRSLISQISIHKLEVFCLVVELQSVSLAAERIGVAQPVVSGHLRTLSDKLGVALMTRVGRQVVPTDEGMRIYGWARDVVVRTQELERELAETTHGTVGKANIVASMTVGSYILPGLVSRFHQRRPAGEISIRVATPGQVMQALLAGECDFGFSILDPRQALEDLDVTPVCDAALLLVASRQFLPGTRRCDPDDLGGLPFVTAQHGTPRREIEEQALRRHGISRRRVELEFGHAEAIKHAVRAGAGVAFLFEASIRDELDAGTLRVIETPALRLEVPIYRIVRLGKTLSRFQSGLMRYLALGMRTAGAVHNMH